MFVGGPVLLVGHSYDGTVITEGGDLPYAIGLVFIAAFAPDAGESPGGITQAHPSVAVPNLARGPDDCAGKSEAASHASRASMAAEVAALIDETGMEAMAGKEYGSELERCLRPSAEYLYTVLGDRTWN